MESLFMEVVVLANDIAFLTPPGTSAPTAAASCPRR